MCARCGDRLPSIACRRPPACRAHAPPEQGVRRLRHSRPGARHRRQYHHVRPHRWPALARNGFPDPGQLVFVHWTAPRSPLSRNVKHPPGASAIRAARTRRRLAGRRVATDGSSPSAPVVPRAGHRGVGRLLPVVGSHPLRGRCTWTPPPSPTTTWSSSRRLWHLLGRDGQTSPLLDHAARTHDAYVRGKHVTVVGVVADNGAIPRYRSVRAHARSSTALAARHPATPPGVTEEQALAELNALAPNLDPSHSHLAHFTIEPAQTSPARNLGVVEALAAATLAGSSSPARTSPTSSSPGNCRRRELATRSRSARSRLEVARLLFAESGRRAGRRHGRSPALALDHPSGARHAAGGIPVHGPRAPQPRGACSWPDLDSRCGGRRVRRFARSSLDAHRHRRPAEGTGGRHSTGTARGSSSWWSPR